MGRARTVWLTAAMAAWLAAPAAAQGAPAEWRARRFVVDAGATFDGGYGAGHATAALRGNAIGVTAPPVTWFDTTSTVNGAAGVRAGVGFALSRSLVVDADVSYSTPRLRVAITGDLEAATPESPEEALQQYEIGAGLRWLMPLRLGARARPYATTGAGYLRQLHQGRTLVETGQTFHAGGGVMYWIRGDGRSRAIGVAADARVTWHTGGVGTVDGARPFSRVTVSAFVGL